MDFATKFSSFRIDLKLDKYSSNISNPILSMWHNKTPKPEIENEDKEDIKNLGPHSLYPKEVYNIHHLYLIGIFLGYGIML